MHNTHYQKLLKNIYVPLDDGLFNVHGLIPSLIPEYNCLEIPFDDDYEVDVAQLIGGLKYLRESGKKVYLLINHVKIDKEILAVMKESLSLDHSGLESNTQEIMEDNRSLDNIMTNLMPLLWLNTSFVLSRLVQPLLGKIGFDTIAISIRNIFRELLHSLFVHILDKVSLSIADTRRNKELKELILESKKYMSPTVGGFSTQFHYICNLYYNNRIAPNELIEFTFVGEKVWSQKGRVRIL